MKSMAGIQYVATLEFFDVLQDGTLIGTVHLVHGGWCFYAAPRQQHNATRYVRHYLPTAVGTSRDSAVYAGLRQVGGLEPNGEQNTV